MPNLRLRRDEVDEDVIPFPTPGTGWQPRPLTTPRPFGRHEAEQALDRVQEQLTKLSLALGSDDDDRPSAA
ncbi:MAG TPA: hypothetical protein VD997_15345 [Phycisphaerales bacterium]|nr:hypothetical protein [Phycisphaerales bacterium]